MSKVEAVEGGKTSPRGEQEKVKPMSHNSDPGCLRLRNPPNNLNRQQLAPAYRSPQTCATIDLQSNELVPPHVPPNTEPAKTYCKNGQLRLPTPTHIPKPQLLPIQLQQSAPCLRSINTVPSLWSLRSATIGLWSLTKLWLRRLSCSARRKWTNGHRTRRAQDRMVSSFWNRRV